MISNIFNNKIFNIFSLLFFLVIIMIIILFIIIYIRKSIKLDRKEVIEKMVKIAIFAAFSSVLYITLKFPLGFLPSFLEINFANVPLILAGFLLGPVEGVIVVIVKALICLPFTHTLCVGDFADLIISISLVFVSSYIYKKENNFKGVIKSLIAIEIVWIVFGLIANAIILIPAYIKLFFNGDLNSFISILSVIPSVNEENYMIKYLLYGALPFNAIISITNIVIIFIMFNALKGFFDIENRKDLNK